MARRIHVEIAVDAPMDDLWRLTQDPALHRRWDLRFSEIAPVPSAGPGPLRFRYSTRVLPNVSVWGTGVHAGERRRPDGGCTSALRFESSHPLSAIREGAGYWRYLPQADGGIRFVTGYDYAARWGRPGRLVDAAVVRPLLGWATAWSFDRLRLWLEDGVPPETSRDRALRDLALKGGAVVVAAGVHPLLGLGALAAAVGAPPRPQVPSARRCRRRPTAPVTEPRIADALASEEAR